MVPISSPYSNYPDTVNWENFVVRKALASSGVIPIESVMGLPLIHQYFSSRCLPYVVVSGGKLASLLPRTCKKNGVKIFWYPIVATIFF